MNNFKIRKKSDIYNPYDDSVTEYKDNVPLHEEGGMQTSFGEVEGNEAKIKVNSPEGEPIDYIVPGKKINNGKYFRKLQSINDKYKRSSFDPIEKKDKNNELLNLVNEVENYKQMNNIQKDDVYNPEKEYGDGGSIYNKFLSKGAGSVFDPNLSTEGTKYSPRTVEEMDNIFDPNTITNDPLSEVNVTGKGSNIGGNYRGLSSLTNQQTQLPTTYNNQVIDRSKDLVDPIEYKNLNSPIPNDVTKDIFNPLSEQQSAIGNKQYTTLPNEAYKQGLVGLLPSVAGNIYNYATAKEEPVNYDRVSPQLINLGRQREVNKQQNDLARNIAQRNARQSGTSGYINYMNTAGAELDRNLGNNLSQSYLQQELQNAQEKARTQGTNVEIDRQETEMRAREKDAFKEQRRNAIQGIMSSIGNYGEGIMQGNRDIKELKSYMSANGYDTYYNPETESWEGVLQGKNANEQPNVMKYADYMKQQRQAKTDKWRTQFNNWQNKGGK